MVLGGSRGFRQQDFRRPRHPSDREGEDSVEKLRPRKTKGISPLLEDRVAVGQDSASPDCSGIELFVEFIVGIFV